MPHTHGCCSSSFKIAITLLILLCIITSSFSSVQSFHSDSDPDEFDFEQQDLDAEGRSISDEESDNLPQVSYDKYQVLKAEINSNLQLDVLKSLENEITDFWPPLPENLKMKYPSSENGFDETRPRSASSHVTLSDDRCRQNKIDLVVSPQNLQAVRDVLAKAEIKFVRSVENLQNIFDNERKGPDNSSIGLNRQVIEDLREEVDGISVNANDERSTIRIGVDDDRSGNVKSNVTGQLDMLEALPDIPASVGTFFQGTFSTAEDQAIKESFWDLHGFLRVKVRKRDEKRRRHVVKRQTNMFTYLMGTVLSLTSKYFVGGSVTKPQHSRRKPKSIINHSESNDQRYRNVRAENRQPNTKQPLEISNGSIKLAPPPSPTHRRKKVISSVDIPSDHGTKKETTGKLSQKDSCYIRETFNFHDFHRLNSFYQYFKCLKKKYPTQVSIIEIGKTYEGRSIVVVKITGKKEFAKLRNKKAIWMDGGIHAREWVSPAQVMRILFRLIEGRKKVDHELLNSFDFYFLPVHNPDGYEYSHTKNRLWRKNRSKNVQLHREHCRGTDLNRNYGFGWGGAGASIDPCRETYRGYNAFSEPETRSVRDFIMKRAGNWTMFFTFHSYGQFILYPYGHKEISAPNHKELHRLGVMATKIIEKGTTYTHLNEVTLNKWIVGPAAETLYAASGASDDWAYADAKIPYAYTLELEDKGQFGFIMPLGRITKSTDVVWFGIRAMIYEVIKTELEDQKHDLCFGC